MDSYLTILSRMKEKYAELSGNTVPDGSDIDIRMKLLAGEIFSGEVNLDFIRRQMFAATAEGEYLDRHAEDRGLSRKPAVKATGIVTFYVNEARDEDITIPVGSIVAASDVTGCRFVTTSGGTLAAGSVRVSLPCIAETGGSRCNVAAEAIDVMVTNVIGIDGVKNTGETSGGVDRESDEELRERILETYKSGSNGTNAAYYRKLAENVDGVKSAKVISRARGAGTVNVNIAGYDDVVSQSKVNEVQALLNDKRELNVDILVAAASKVYVTLGLYLTVESGFSFNKVKNAVTAALGEYIASLGVGDDVLETRLGQAIMEVDGVYDYRWMSNYDSFYAVADNEFAVLSAVNITEDS